MGSIPERKIILSVNFIFTVMLLVTHRAALFTTSISTALHCQPILWKIILLVLRILLNNKELRREGRRYNRHDIGYLKKSLNNRSIFLKITIFF